MQPIIDAHGHLGDILYPDGGRLIDAIGVEKESVFDPASLGEARLHRDRFRLAYPIFRRAITRAERARNATATLENLRRSLEEVGISHSVCLPVPPHVGFEDLRAAAGKERSVVPFTGVDFTALGAAGSGDPGASFEEDVRAGARGLKLHPIIQRTTPSSSGFL